MFLQTIIKIGAVSPIILASTADSLIEVLDATVRKVPKEGLIGPEADRVLELVRSGIRVVSLVSKLPDISSNTAWTSFVDKLAKSNINLTDVSL